MDSYRPSPQSSRRSLSIFSRDHALELTLMLMWVVFAVLATVFASGCDRAVFVPEASPMRVGPHSQIRVWMLVDGKWSLSTNKIDVPEGWYLVPPS